MLKKGEKFEPLGNQIEVIVNNIHHFSTDTILLSNFAMTAKHSKCIDLGSGCGTIPLILVRTNNQISVTAVEIQQQAADMICRSVKHNNLEKQIKVINADLKDLKGKVPFGYYDLVVCNPPYKHSGSGITNPDQSKVIARHESACTINDITLSASKLLQFGGRFCMCQRPERLTDILISMRENDIEPKKLRFVQQRAEKAPKLFLIEGRKGGKKGNLVTLPTLFIEDGSGKFSKEMIDIYGEYKS